MNTLRSKNGSSVQIIHQRVERSAHALGRPGSSYQFGMAVQLADAEASSDEEEAVLYAILAKQESPSAYHPSTG